MEGTEYSQSSRFSARFKRTVGKRPPSVVCRRRRGDGGGSEKAPQLPYRAPYRHNAAADCRECLSLLHLMADMIL